MKAILITVLMLGSVSSFAAENKSANAQAIDTACSADATTAGCSGEKVGNGLLKCMWGYKKAHHDFKFSDGCKAAMKKGHQDRTAAKGA
jgi:hypothetical protein